MTLGLEIRDASAAAVAVDAAGVIAARALVESTGDLAAAAVEAVEAVGRTAGSGPLGIAAIQPHASSSDAVIASLQQRYAGPFVQHGVMSAGIAAVVGVLRDARPIAGVGSRAASIAWLALNPVDREDYRKIGCLEAEVSRPRRCSGGIPFNIHQWGLPLRCCDARGDACCTPLIGGVLALLARPRCMNRMHRFCIACIAPQNPAWLLGLSITAAVHRLCIASLFPASTPWSMGGDAKPFCIAPGPLLLFLAPY